MQEFKNVYSTIFPEVKVSKTKVRVPSNVRTSDIVLRQRLLDDIEKQLEEKLNHELEILEMLGIEKPEEIIEEEQEIIEPEDMLEPGDMLELEPVIPSEYDMRMDMINYELEMLREELMSKVEEQVAMNIEEQGIQFVYDEVVYEMAEYMKIENEMVMNINMAVDATMFGLDDIATLQVAENEALDATMLALDEIIISNEEIIADLQGQLEMANSEIAELKSNMAILADRLAALETPNEDEGEEE